MSDANTPITPTDIRCIDCGYDISGSPIGGTCPECGKSVYESIRAVQIVQKRDDTAANCMILGIISIITCGAFSPFAIWLYYNARKELAEAENPSRFEKYQATAGLLMAIFSIFIIPIAFSILSMIRF